jgi:5,10-methylenetetrahydrofolate reductase
VTFADLLAAGRFPVALEITPPKGSLPAVLLRRARLLGEAAAAVNVIQRPGRQPSLDASIELLAAGVEPVWHLVTRGLAREALAAGLARARAAAIDQLLIIRGDHEAPDAPGALTIRETIARAREALPGALIGATVNQHLPDRAAVLRNLLPKLAAGASYVQTQPVFTLEDLRPLAETLRDRSPATKIVAMAMPLLSEDARSRVAQRLNVPIQNLKSKTQNGAWPAFTALLADLAASPLVDGLAIMTFEMDAPPETGARIVASLQAAGIDTNPKSRIQNPK